MIVRPITVDDIQSIVGYLYTHSKAFDPKERICFWENAFNLDKGIGFIAYEDAIICGSIAGRIDLIESIGTIDTLFITSEHRATGLSTILLNEFESAMHKKSIKVIAVKAEKSVISFLKKNGYNTNTSQFKIKELSYV